MARDTQIFSGADHAGNSDYTLPGNSEIRVLAVNADFTDNGAGADWCPAVVMFSDSGHVIARAMLPDVKVTAGDDAEVSWFPGVKPSGATVTSTSVGIAKAYRDSLGGAGDPAQTVNANSNANASFPHADTTNASAMFWSTSVLQNDTLNLDGPASYLCFVTTHWDLVSLNLSSILMEAGQFGFPHRPWEPEKVPRFGDAIGYADNMDMNVLHVTSGGTTIHVSHSNNTASSQVVQQCYFTVVYLATG